MLRINRNYLRLSLIICFAWSVLFFLSSCQTFKTSGQYTGVLPDELHLQTRIKQFHDALGNNDIATRYAMTSHVITRKMTLDQYKKDFRWDEKAVNKTKISVKAELGKTCSCEQQIYLRCVLVINIGINEPGHDPKTESPLETWEYADGEWFWAYMGPDTKGRCPGQ